MVTLFSFSQEKVKSLALTPNDLKRLYMYGMGEPRIKIVAMPKDTNPSGNIFGGWIMSQIDVAGALAARDANPERVVTVAVNSMEFKKPVQVGDILSCYAKIIKVGRSSIQTSVEVVAERMAENGWSCIHVTSAVITYVSVDKDGNKQPLERTAKIIADLDLDHPECRVSVDKGHGI